MSKTILLMSFLRFTFVILGTSLWLGCEGEIQTNITPLDLNLNQCLDYLKFDKIEESCAQGVGSNPRGCFLIEGLNGNLSSASVTWTEGRYLSVTEGSEENLESAINVVNEEPTSAALVFFSEGVEYNCSEQTLEGDCEGDCVVKVRFLLQETDLGRAKIVKGISTVNEADYCEWLTPEPAIERCDGFDNNCDGEVDEGYSVGVECFNQSLGVCRLKGTMLCNETGGSYCAFEQDPVAPSEELCDGLDNDCDGRLDEGFPEKDQACEVPVGEHLSPVSSIYRCKDGALICPAEELCDGVDNDADGQVDEGFGLGDDCEPIDISCYSRTGQIKCVTPDHLSLRVSTSFGELGEAACIPNQITIMPEGTNGCDGEDNDCDGYIDEEYVITQLVCGVSSCVNLNGRRLCIDGEIINDCEPLPNEAPDDNCDGVDNDCDNLIDEGFFSYQSPCDGLVGECARVSRVYCVDRVPRQICPNFADLKPLESEQDQRCDGLDNDCDGQTDEGFNVTSTECGLGVCHSQGERSCINGFEVDSCTEGEPLGEDTTCNGVDEDCDGKIDESYIIQPYSCFLGQCIQWFNTRCVVSENGSEIFRSCPEESLIQPQNDQQCDGLDNDCDGQVDEAYLVSEIDCGEGVCEQSGLITCVNGEVINDCVPIELESEVVDICDGLDNDCDGEVDEGFLSEDTPCIGDVQCEDLGITTCINGILGDTCSDVIIADHPEDICDGIDQDCDGEVDEGYLEVVTTCGIGQCASTGVTFCSLGVEGDSCQIGTATDDKNCDGFDQDCDGQIDEGYQTNAILCGQGECLKGGLKYCLNGEVIIDCTPSEPVADENCNGKDEDCDGFVDEGYALTSITCGVGVCERTGTRTCISSGVQENCTAGSPQGLDHDCDGFDNDCDGSIDEGFVGQVLTCGFGPCEVVTRATCVDGVEHRVCEPLAPSSATDTLCNQIDEDCDGNLDENYVRLEESCGPGSCEDTALTICTQTGVVSTCSYQSSPVDQTCNGVDEDCDGLIDENYIPPQTQETCGQGVCLADAEVKCLGGSARVVCQPGDSIGDDNDCNGMDDDCDGLVDESYRETETCGVGVCERTVTLTVCGTECIPNSPGFELCGDLLDNDCDGQTDEGFEERGDPCTVGVGACANEGVLKCQNQNLTAPLICSVTAGLPQQEICDTFDNDCDARIDEETIGVSPDSCVIPTFEGTSCYSGLESCVEGSILCQGIVIPNELQENYCTVIDEDCDPSTINQVTNSSVSSEIPFENSTYDIQLGEICGYRSGKACKWTCLQGIELECYYAKKNQRCTPD